jgi:hypothetical protein
MKRNRQGILLAAVALAGVTVGVALPGSINASHAQGTEQSEPSLTTCPKCKGAMEPGVFLDNWSENSIMQAEFAKKVPRLIPLMPMPKMKKIMAYCCTNCGFMEVYAR